MATVGRERLGQFDAEEVALQLLGDAIYANPLLLGYAWQRGWLPLGQAALRRAFELDGRHLGADKAEDGARECDLFSAGTQPRIGKRYRLDKATRSQRGGRLLP